METNFIISLTKIKRQIKIKTGMFFIDESRYLIISFLIKYSSQQSLAADCRDDIPSDDCLEKVYGKNGFGIFCKTNTYMRPNHQR